MRFVPRTILGQLIAGSVLVQTVVFSTFMVVAVRREMREQAKRDGVRLMRQTHTMAGVLGEPLATSNMVLLDYVMHAVPVSLTISSVRVTDAAGRTLRTSSREMPPQLTQREQSLLPALRQRPVYQVLQDQDGASEGVQAVVVDGVIRGFVWITPNLSVFRQLSVMDLENLSSFAVFALLGNLLMIWWFSTSLARPLRHLRFATQQVQSDPTDLSAFPLPATAQNEAGELQASFNAMVSEIALQRRGTQETLNLLDAMLESAPVGFAFFDRELRFVRLNHNLARMNGVPMQFHLGKRYRDLLPTGAATNLADETERALAEVFRTRAASGGQEMSGGTPGSDELRTWQVTMFPVETADEELRWAGVIVVDITERKRTEEAMRRSERLASAGRLAATIADEMSNPLESVTNLLYLLRSNLSLNADAQECVGLAQSELGRIGEVTQQTLKFYRSSTTSTDVRFPELLRSVLALHQARMQLPWIEVKLRFDETAIAFGYVGELHQVFAKLIGNAIDAMPEGGTLYIRVRPARSQGKQGTRVTVADTGVGIPDAVRQRIFEPFFTGKSDTGTGPGLWGSAEILKKHKARLLIRSLVAKSAGNRSGTVISIFFPYEGVPRGPVRVISAAQAPANQVV